MMIVEMGMMPPEARTELNKLQGSLKVERNELRRLEAHYRKDMSTGRKLAVLAVLCGPPLSVTVPVLYMAIKTMNYKLAKEMYRIEIRQKYQEANCAKRMIGLINNKEGISERYFQSPAQSQEQSRGMRMKR